MQTATQQQKIGVASFGRTFIVGSVAGIVSAILSNVLAWGIMIPNDYKFEMLNEFSITLSAFFANLIGAFIYRTLRARTSKAVLYYAILSLVMAILTTVNTVLNPMEPHIGTVANPLHFLVAASSSIMVPIMMNRYSKKQDL